MSVMCSTFQCGLLRRCTMIVLIMAACVLSVSAAQADVFLERFINRLTLPTFVGKREHLTVQLTGRLLTDVWSVAGGGRNPGDPDRTNGIYDDGFELRTLRLGVAGRLMTKWRYHLDADYDGDDVDLSDFYLRYTGWKWASLTLGHHKEPFGLEEATGRLYTAFMERALPVVFAPGRALGISLFHAGKDYTIAGGVFGPGFNDSDSSSGSDPLAFTARATWAPISTGKNLMHLGLSATLRDLNGSGANFRINTRPEIRVLNSSLLDTGQREATGVNKFAFEFAFANDRFALQSEYSLSNVKYEDATSGSPTFDGFYVTASWYLTGETRRYARGRFQRVSPLKPLGGDGKGAFQIALRFSKVDLNDPKERPFPIRGGNEENWSAGVNWYMTSHARMMFNAVRFKIKGSTATMPLGFENHRGWGLGTRFQIDW